jgi:hypothetical protein
LFLDHYIIVFGSRTIITSLLDHISGFAAESAVAAALPAPAVLGAITHQPAITKSSTTKPPESS